MQQPARPACEQARDLRIVRVRVRVRGRLRVSVRVRAGAWVRGRGRIWQARHLRIVCIVAARWPLPGKG